VTCKLCADHEEHGALKEQERIINLLESQAAIDKHLPFLVHLIALIKGENKFYETSCVCCNGEHWG
jgi:hypothetical protein